ncbi:DUF4179 domain-containing protein [Clostridium sporogenes]|uniref:DUF4179 domain-containing protein n=1 Tax=Clostridium sporogenes TaxID=1509 RepID=UPI0013CF409F|nr:DUF4179 domain-containing protein [Clostridium sporogenes]NFF66468.1 DUF4179 domain-containing protein [Clostridium sporogenes]NFF99650.1 DUF4179 domain-containing protein [Clostridium sporogenes]NFG05716.1 DUF4179 domain-containing protein [Clostridium sporogenes]NFG49869.1 DUF4179 domain-containing protein [Clostridium sporogenes]NFP84998.1 DUF4179 domain-containing protein [Clostridium sporogenes]
MENNFEKELKELIKNSEDIKVPPKISAGVDELLDNLQSNSTNGKKVVIKRISIVVILVLIFLTGFVSTFPTLAAEIPIINKLAGNKSLFNKIESSEYGDEFKNLSKLNNVSVEINKGVSRKGITITIKEIAYDEAAFYVVYEVSLDKKLKNKEYLNNLRSNVKVNGKSYEASAQIPLNSDDKKTTITEVFAVTGGDTIPDKFDFNINFIQDDNSKESWNFKIPLIKQNLQNKVDILRVNQNIRDGFNSMKIVKLSSSPAYLSLLAKFKKYEPDKYDYIIMDSKGNEYEQVDIGGIVEKKFSTDVTFFYKQIEKNKLESITILKSKVEKYSPNKLKNVQYIPLNSKLPIDISVGKGKKVTVNSISQKNDQLEIMFTAKEIPLYTFGFEGGISIYDKTMDKKDKEAYDIIRMNVLGNNRYKSIIPIKRGINKNDKFIEYDRDINKAFICIGNYDEMYKEIEKIDLKK